jgi:hypothetical protein
MNDTKIEKPVKKLNLINGGAPGVPGERCGALR